MRRLLSTISPRMHEKLVAIVGTTGVGKSQLAVELAKALDGEVINADSMQVYQGLDIITNKITQAEREGVPHHLMDFLLPHQEYRVTEFETDALGIISSINRRGQLPIVVGGTNYYIQSLLWRDSLITSSTSPTDTPASSSLASSSTKDDDLDADAPGLYKRLQEVDPVMANRWHPSDQRKIRRSLEAQRHHQGAARARGQSIKAEVRRSPNTLDDLVLRATAYSKTPTLFPPVRFKVCIFWLYADPTHLDPRLDARVDKMIQGGEYITCSMLTTPPSIGPWSSQTGLFEELRLLRAQVGTGDVRMPGTEDKKYQRGIWQAIGYKEFDPYLTALESTDPQPADTLIPLKLSCTDIMKAATRRYAKKQVSWIRKKLLPATQASEEVTEGQGTNVRMYLLDATSLDHWNEHVRDTAVRLTRDFFANNPTPDPTTLCPIAHEMLTTKSIIDTATRVFTWQKHTCEVCVSNGGVPMMVNGDREWEQHLRSQRHRRNVAKRKNEEQRKIERGRRDRVTEGEEEGEERGKEGDEEDEGGEGKVRGEREEREEEGKDEEGKEKERDGMKAIVDGIEKIRLV
ncbi:IPP transferase-domain-containing protein [Endogone sp. FLAS-F59071]|nr:IPP transferase-domain-containing protein [Endogone sp. FLAS-F59071]|eukprot:RUS17983.1 IPP transferase-domain-containing protein [Endogone sp. FLAS-F59071]